MFLLYVNYTYIYLATSTQRNGVAVLRKKLWFVHYCVTWSVQTINIYIYMFILINTNDHVEQSQSNANTLKKRKLAIEVFRLYFCYLFSVYKQQHMANSSRFYSFQYKFAYSNQNKYH